MIQPDSRSETVREPGTSCPDVELRRTRPSRPRSTPSIARRAAFPRVGSPLCRLDAFLNGRILNDPDPVFWWGVKVRAKRVLAQAVDVDQLAERILAILHARHRPRRRLAA